MGQKPFDLKERTFLFAVRMLKVASILPENSEARIVRRQLARAGSSVGSNVEEADGATTKPESRRLFVVARREARESRYWLKIINHLWSPGVNVEGDVKEASELINILSTIILKLGDGRGR